MIIGVLSDTHDRVPLITAALDLFARRGTESIIHAGDICSPFAAKALKLAEQRGPLYVLFGNNEGETAGLKSILPQLQRGPLRLELDGTRILVHHFEKWCDPQDVSWADVVITGHTHEVVNEVRDGKLFLNPGECCGWVNGRCTVAILDTNGPGAEIVELAP
jgi:putative phosphoesterase